MICSVMKYNQRETFTHHCTSAPLCYSQLKTWVEGRLVGCPCFDIFRSGDEVRSAKVTKLLAFWTLIHFHFRSSWESHKTLSGLPKAKQIYQPHQRIGMIWGDCHWVTATMPLTPPEKQSLNHQQPTRSHLNNTSTTKITPQQHQLNTDRLC